jgi:hypothetical protein
VVLSHSFSIIRKIAVLSAVWKKNKYFRQTLCQNSSSDVRNGNRWWISIPWLFLAWLLGCKWNSRMLYFSQEDVPLFWVQDQRRMRQWNQYARNVVCVYGGLFPKIRCGDGCNWIKYGVGREYRILPVLAYERPNRGFIINVFCWWNWAFMCASS